MICYHISREDFGPRHLFVPRVPTSRSKEEDGKILRVCAAPTLVQCLMAVDGCPDILVHPVRFSRRTKGSYTVYRFNIRTKFIFADDSVPDAHRTNEIWILKPVVGERIGYLVPLKPKFEKFMTIRERMKRAVDWNELVINHP